MSFLPALASFFNPANVIQGIGKTVTGVLDSISKGQGLNLASNLSKGIQTALGENNSPPNDGKSNIGSTTGQFAFSPTVSSYPHNQASNLTAAKNAKLNTLIPAMKNAASYKPVYVDNSGRGGIYKNNAINPQNGIAQLSGDKEPDTLDIQGHLPSAPAGLPSFEVKTVQQRRAPKKSKIVLRDNNGYKGYQTNTKLNIPSMKLKKPK